MNVTRARLTAGEAARVCGVEPVTVRRWARRGILTPAGANGSLHFRPEDVLVRCLDECFQSRRLP